MNAEDFKIGLEMAKLSKAAYAGPINHLLYRVRGIKLEGQKIIHGSFGRGYCRIFWNDNHTVVAFRGTRESVDWRIANFRAFPVRLRDCGIESKVLVHRGFQNTLDYGDKTTDLRSVDAVFEYLQEFDLLDRKILITGHSMGGALALLFAVKFRAKFKVTCEKNLEEIITFAAPSVGLKSFKDFFGYLSQRTTRYVNEADVVPFTPPVLFHHVGSEIWLSQGSAKPNVGWKTRLAAGLGARFVGTIRDHHISSYIRNIEREISKLASDS